MAKAKKTSKKRANKYDEKLAVKGSFLDLMKIAAQDAKQKSKGKK